VIINDDDDDDFERCYSRGFEVTKQTNNAKLLIFQRVQTNLEKKEIILIEVKHLCVCMCANRLNCFFFSLLIYSVTYKVVEIN
jgi:hypothetical protein